MVVSPFRRNSAPDIWRLSLGESSLIPLTQNTEVSGNSMIFPKDESTPWGGNGVQVYWQNEAAAASGSKPYLGTNTLVLHKMISLVPVTNELIQDGFAIGSYLSQVAPERIAYKANEAILFRGWRRQTVRCADQPCRRRAGKGFRAEHRNDQRRQHRQHGFAADRRRAG